MCLSLTRRFWISGLVICVVAASGHGTAMVIVDPAISKTRQDTTVQSWTLSLRRSGPVQIGMTVQDVRNALNDPRATLVPAQSGLARPPCSTLDSVALPEQITLMFQRERLTRINVHDVGPRTEAGAGVGDADDRIRQMYEGRIEITRHPYLDDSVGRYLIYRSADRADHDYGMIFETRNGRVTSFRVGQRAAVNLISGCG